MHIEPGIVTGAKLLLGYATASGAAAWGMKRAVETIRDTGAGAFALRAAASTTLVFCFFQVLPHVPVGISEVHLILGSTRFLVFGAAPAALGLALGLLIQGLLFAPFDLPQYGMNTTTLLVPLFALEPLARRIVPKATAYVDLDYAQVLRLSLAYQGGIVAWVAFWAVWGLGFEMTALERIASFGTAYMLVVLIEPLVDLGVLALAKRMRRSAILDARLYATA
jgi:ABC-type Co2+ transport system permease subunit